MMLLAMLSLFWCLVEVHSTPVTPYLSFMDNNLTNHSYVKLTTLETLECNSVLRNCCNGTLKGNWYFPNGSELTFPGGGDDIYQSRGKHKVVLLRRNNITANSATGLYRCYIPYEPTVFETFYVGLYTNGGMS